MNNNISIFPQRMTLLLMQKPYFCIQTTNARAILYINAVCAAPLLLDLKSIAVSL